MKTMYNVFYVIIQEMVMNQKSPHACLYANLMETFS